MAEFTYTARDDNGSTRSGKLTAKNRKKAMQLLRKKHLMPLEFHQKGEIKFIEDLLAKLNRVKIKDVVVFTRQLASIINAGIPLMQALQLIYDQTSHPKIQKAIAELISDMEGGMSFADSLAKHPGIFSNLFVNIVKSGEVSGTLDTSLISLADQMGKDSEAQGKIKGAMMMPGILLVAIVGVVILMSVSVIPQLSSMFTESGTALPIPTLIMLGLSDFLLNLWYVAIILVVGVVFGIKKYFSTPHGKVTKDIIALKAPVFGDLNKIVIFSRFTRVLSLLLESGVPLLRGLYIIQDLVGNSIYSKAFHRVANKIEKGIPLAQAIEEEDEIFPPMIPQMIGIGEQTGGVDVMLKRLATLYQNDADNMIKNLSTLLEPLLMAVMGGVVGFIIMAIMMPIYQLTTVIN